MNKSELIEKVAVANESLTNRDVYLATNILLREIKKGLSQGRRTEIRHFGSFSLRSRPSRMAHNPQDMTPVFVREQYVVHFKPSKTLRGKVI